MTDTTIQIPTDLRDRLREERADHETNYGDTIRRLLGDAGDGSVWTEAEIREVVREELGKATEISADD